MRDSMDEVSLPQPELRAASRVARFFVAATVVLAFAGAGYIGSRIWPLSAVSRPAVHLAAGGTTSSTEPASLEGAQHPTSRVSKSPVATDASAPLRVSSHSQPAAA